MKQLPSNSTKSDADQSVAAKSEMGHTDEQGWLSRWSQRKLAMRDVADSFGQQVETSVSEVEQLASQDIDALPTDADMPPIESLTESSDYSGFMSPKVSEHLRRQALRKLFLSSSFNVCDGLDDYDEDFTQFAKLGDIVTADMKHRMNVLLQKEMEEAAAQQPESKQHQDAEAERHQISALAESSDEPECDTPHHDS